MMVGIIRTDIEQAINNKFGFADHVKPIKWDLNKGLVVVVSVNMSYFTPKGKARMKPVYTYSLYKGHECILRSTKKADCINMFKKETK